MCFWHRIVNSGTNNQLEMEYAYYKGKRYEAKAVEIGGNRLYTLYNTEGTLLHFVTEQQLDKRSLIDMCIETYLRFSERI